MNITDTNTSAEKNTRECIGPYIYLYLECITRAKGSRL
jgi:hypothetical protein